MKVKRKPVHEYVEYQLNIFRNQCNFTDEELEFFNYRAKKKTMAEIEELMSISRSKVFGISSSVKTKMDMVIEVYFQENETNEE